MNSNFVRRLLDVKCLSATKQRQEVRSGSIRSQDVAQPQKILRQASVFHESFEPRASTARTVPTLQVISKSKAAEKVMSCPSLNAQWEWFMISP